MRLREFGKLQPGMLESKSRGCDERPAHAASDTNRGSHAQFEPMACGARLEAGNTSLMSLHFAANTLLALRNRIIPQQVPYSFTFEPHPAALVTTVSTFARSNASIVLSPDPLPLLPPACTRRLRSTAAPPARRLRSFCRENARVRH